MKVNSGKCAKNPIDVLLDVLCITSGSSEKLFGIAIDSDLKCDKHIYMTFVIK